MVMRTRRLLVLALALTGILVLTGCGTFATTLLDNLHEVEVVNLCGGDDLTVDVYFNDAYMGSVYLNRTFTVLTGPLDLRAEGTGYYGTTFTRSTFVSSDIEWTLCPA